MYGPKWVRVTNQLTCFELLLPPPDVDLCMSIPPVYSRSPLPQFLTNLALSGKIYCKDTYQNLEKIFRVNFESRSTAHPSGCFALIYFGCWQDDNIRRTYASWRVPFNFLPSCSSLQRQYLCIQYAYDSDPQHKGHYDMLPDSSCLDFSGIAVNMI